MVLPLLRRIELIIAIQHEQGTFHWWLYRFLPVRPAGPFQLYLVERPERRGLVRKGKGALPLDFITTHGRTDMGRD